MIVLWNSAEMTACCTLIDNGKRYDYEWQAGRSLARDMLTYLRDTLALHGKTFNDIAQIGVFRGPGSFTGLRIGLSVLNTIAAARQIPIVGASGVSWQSECLTRLARQDDDRLVVPEYGADAHVTKPRK
jgi:tRNA threonylcarbamoyladenosine biosynthesis protein TsaB